MPRGTIILETLSAPRCGTTARLEVVHALTLPDARWTFLGGVFRPFRDRAEPDTVLRRVPVDSDGEFAYLAGVRRANVVFAELRNGNRDGLIEAFGIDVDAMKNAVKIDKGDAAAGTGHIHEYNRIFAFSSPRTR